MASLSQEQFMRLMAGVDLPGPDNIYAPDADPRQQLISQLGGAGLTDAVSQGVGLADLLGVNAQKPQYRFDDNWKVIGDLLDLQTQGAKAGIQAQQDEQALGMKQQQLGMETEQHKQQYGDPEAQMRLLMARGYDPQTIVDLYENPADDNTFVGGIDQIDKDLGEMDQYGQPLNIHSEGGISRHNNLYNYAKQMVTARQEEQSAKMQKSRWKDLTPNFRAKEIFLRMQDPTSNVAVDRYGNAYTGDDAEQQAAQAMEKAKKAPYKNMKKMSYKEWDKQTRQKGQDQRLQSRGVANPGTVLQTSMPSSVGSGIRWGA